MNRIAVVTGANGGIGKAVCNTLRFLGYVVIGVDLEFDGDEPFISFKGDATKNVEMKNLKDYIDRGKRDDYVHCLINCAGVHDNYKKFEEIGQIKMMEIVEKNILSITVPVSKFIDDLKESKGKIINVGSIAGLEAGGGGVAYTMAKHAVHGLTKQLALEFAQYGVTVNAVAPACVRTAMTEEDFRNGESEEVVKRIPLGKYAEPEHIANVVGFLVSEGSSYITGEILNVDGGWMASHYVNE